MRIEAQRLIASAPPEVRQAAATSTAGAADQRVDGHAALDGNAGPAGGAADGSNGPAAGGN